MDGEKEMKLAYKKEILNLLMLDSKTRDNDIMLYAYLLKKLYPDINSEVLKFLWQIDQGLYPHFETIRRTRQKIQEEIPEVRGEKYILRHKSAAKFRKEIVKPNQL